MASGKFSKPRSHFSEEPAASRPSGKSPQPSTPVQHPFPEEELEEQAIEQAFREVSESEEYESDSNLPPFLEKVLDFIGKNKKVVLVSSCAVVLVLLVAVIGIFWFASASDPYDGKILNNVTIAGVNVGGMTKSEAEDAVRAVTDDTFTQQDMVIVLPDTTLNLSPDNTGAKLDVKAAVKAAYSYGRTGTEAEQQQAYQNSLTGNHIIGLLPYLGLDTAYIQSVLDEYAAQFGSTFKETTYELQGEMPALEAEGFDENAPCQTLVVTIGTPGFGLNIETIYNDILDAYSFNRFSVTVDEVSVDATPEPLDLEAVYQEFYIAPINASLDMQTYEPIPGVYGYGFDIEQAQKLLDAADYGETVQISMEYIEPEITEDNVLFRDVLGECETPHSDNENRNTNLRLACEALDGVIVNPGETFSYNDTLGERTSAKGYKPAPAYSGTVLVNSVGGGVCQGSSTLYLATLRADLEIVHRVNHGFLSSYIDPGLDATVNWGGPDYQFRNNTNFPIMIKAEVSDGYMRMQILGTDERDYYVEMEYEITGYITPSIEYEDHEAGSGYYDGQILAAGSSGPYVKTYKCKYDKETGELISRDFETRSTYRATNTKVVRIVGGTPAETTPPSSGGSTGGDSTGGSTGGDTGGSTGGSTGGDAGGSAGGSTGGGDAGGSAGGSIGGGDAGGGDAGGGNAGGGDAGGGDAGGGDAGGGDAGGGDTGGGDAGGDGTT